MSDPFNNHAPPRAALLGLLGLVVFALLAVIVAQLAGFKAGEPLPDDIVASRDLRFVDKTDGLVLVTDAADDRVIARMEPGTENFVRGVIRGLARERRAHSKGSVTPFRVARHADGRLTLQDMATGRQLDLKAFGATNAASFERLLDDGSGGS